MSSSKKNDSNDNDNYKSLKSDKLSSPTSISLNNLVNELREFLANDDGGKANKQSSNNFDEKKVQELIVKCEDFMKQHSDLSYTKAQSP